MDVVSAVASLTTLITFALQSSQVLFQTANAVIDGPCQVVRFAGQVETLRRMLNRMAELVVKGKQASHSENTSVFADIKSSIQMCVEDLQRLQAKMSKLQAAVTSNNLRRIGSIVKIILGSKDFEEMEKIVPYHVQVLNTQLSIFGT